MVCVPRYVKQHTTMHYEKTQILSTHAMIPERWSISEVR